MHIATRVTVSLGTLLAACGALYLALPVKSSQAPVTSPPSPHETLSCPAPIAPPIAPARAPEPAAVVAIEDNATLGDADPPIFAHDDNPEALALARFLGKWGSDPTEPGPAIEYRRGVVFAESEEDRGDDGPYPRSAGPEAIHACGTQAFWLLSALRESLRYTELYCTATSCTFGGMEYAPSGELKFHHAVKDGRDTWVLESWSQAYVSALNPEIAAENTRFVNAAVKRLSKARCPGEPAGTSW